MKAKHVEIFRLLYSTLTTSQINKALRSGGFTHDDWMDFVMTNIKTDPAETLAAEIVEACDDLHWLRENSFVLDGELQQLALSRFPYMGQDEVDRVDAAIDNILDEKEA